jgi:hypothetical protein
MGLEEEVLPPPTKASKQTSMLTPNNTSEALLFSCTLKKHLIRHNERPAFLVSTNKALMIVHI